MSKYHLCAYIVLVTCAIAITADTHSQYLDTQCPYRTINYITHTLPQLCLPSIQPESPTSATSIEASTFPHALSSGTTTEAAPDSDTRTQTLPSSSVVLTIITATDSPVDTSLIIIDAPSIISPVPAATNAVSHIDVVEDESALESGNFLSFEDWKRQNLEKAGQSEHVGSILRPEMPGSRKRPGSGQNTLDSLGDDLEIDIDFSGIMPEGPEPSDKGIAVNEDNRSSGDDEFDNARKGSRRSRDAGTTCKERFNYASFDCAANVLKTNNEAKSPNTILVENKDSYMLNVCSAKEKFIVLELCNDILIDTVVLANFEFFSSTFRTFRVSVSDRYPVRADKWKLVGTYEASNTRGIQAFLVEDPVIWARYVRIDFMTHYGNEFYCPVSLVRVHGTTMMDEYKNDMEFSVAHDNDEDDIHDTGERVFDLGERSNEEYLKTTGDSKSNMTGTTEAHSMIVSEAHQNLTTTITTSRTNGTSAITTANVPISLIVLEAISSVIAPKSTCRSVEGPPGRSSTNIASSTPFQPTTASKSNPTTTQKPMVTEAGWLVGLDSDHNDASVGEEFTSSATTAWPEVNTIPGQERVPINQFREALFITTEGEKVKPNASTTDKTKSSATAVQAQVATPTVQESFFKSVQKRLQMLEANSTLSLQYIEDQSRALRDAFKRVEQRQLIKTTLFLEQLNATVLNELRDFRQQYDQLWQSTVIELAMQRERYEQDNQAINARLGILADEVIFQRRMGILQMCLILACLVLVLFSRGSINNYLELPMVQNMLAKSQHSRWLNLSGVESPARKPSTLRKRSAQQLRTTLNRQKGHQRMQSEDSITDHAQSGTGLYTPPNSVSYDERLATQILRDDGPNTDFDSEREVTPVSIEPFSPSDIERPMTSPPRLVINPGTPIDSNNGLLRDVDPVMHRRTQDLGNLADAEIHASNDRSRISLRDELNGMQAR